MGDIQRPRHWNYEQAGVDWEARAREAAHVAGKNAIRAQDVEAEVESLRQQLEGAVDALAQAVDALGRVQDGDLYPGRNLAATYAETLAALNRVGGSRR